MKIARWSRIYETWHSHAIHVLVYNPDWHWFYHSSILTTGYLFIYSSEKTPHTLKYTKTNNSQISKNQFHIKNSLSIYFLSFIIRLVNVYTVILRKCKKNLNFFSNRKIERKSNLFCFCLFFSGELIQLNNGVEFGWLRTFLKLASQWKWCLPS